MAMIKAPDILPKIRKIVLMGGAMNQGGNTSPSAEFNMLVDPHAAHRVFSARVPIVMMPLDVTHQALSTPERIAAIRALGTPVPRPCADPAGRPRSGRSGSP